MKKNEQTISIVAQGFYGNCTATKIAKAKIDRLLKGYISDDLPCSKTPDVELRFIKVPGADHIVIVYDQKQEDDYVNVEFPEYYAREGANYRELWGDELKMHVTCEIPELNFILHTRCFACRIDNNGEFQSLQEQDTPHFLRFFPVK